MTMEAKRKKRDLMIKEALSGKSMQQQEMKRQSLQEQSPTLSTMRGGGNSTSITWRTQDGGGNDGKTRQNSKAVNYTEIKPPYGFEKNQKGQDGGGQQQQLSGRQNSVNQMTPQQQHILMKDISKKSSLQHSMAETDLQHHTIEGTQQNSKNYENSSNSKPAFRLLQDDEEEEEVQIPNYDDDEYAGEDTQRDN